MGLNLYNLLLLVDAVKNEIQKQWNDVMFIYRCINGLSFNNL